MKLLRTAMIAAALFATISSASAGTPADRSPAFVGLGLDQLRARYTLPNSKFVTLDGVSIHYTDEGHGPVVLLLHGSFLDLTAWQPWVDDLRRDHRVIRVDRLSQGLTGAYAGEPVDYDHEQRMLDALIAHLKLGRLAVVGSSSGGIVAAQLADRHPDQVARVILMNFPLGHARIMGFPPAPVLAVKETPLEETRTLIARNLVDHAVITDRMVTRMTAFRLRKDESGALKGAYERAASYTEAQRAAMLGRLRMPVLVMWSEKNETLPVSDGQAAFAAIGSKDKTFAVVPGAGHMMPLEKGAESVVVARKFLNGAFPQK